MKFREGQSICHTNQKPSIPNPFMGEKVTQKTLYDLGLGDEMAFHGFTVTRVPGGWIFQTRRQGSDLFIPYNNEFDNRGGLLRTPTPTEGSQL